MQVLEFQNEPIDITSLPAIDHNAFHQIEKRHLSKSLTSWGLRFMFFIGIFIGVYLAAKNEIPTYIYIIIASVLLLINLISLFFTLKAHPVKSYQIREKDISYQKGYMFYKLTTIPYNRIQHVEIKQDFIDKMFKLAVIKVYTAGGVASDLAIPGLTLETATQLKEQLTKNIADYEQN